MHDSIDSRNKLRHLGESLVNHNNSLSDTQLFKLLDAFEEQDFAALHFSKLTGSRSDSGHTEQKYVFGSPECAKHEAMKLACHRANIFVDEHQCNPRGVYLYAGGSVQIAVRSGPPQSFRVTSSLSHDIEETPSVAAGQKHDWSSQIPGKYHISSNIYPGCQAFVTVVPSTVRASMEKSPEPAQSMSQVDEHILLPLATSCTSIQTEPVQKVSRFAATESAQLPPLRPFNPQASCSAKAGTDLSSSDESLVYNQTGLRRRISQQPASAGSVSSDSAPSMDIPLRAATPDIGMGIEGSNANARISRHSSSTSQDSPQSSPATSTGPIFRPACNLGSLQRSMSPVSTHSSDETMPLLDIRMNNRVQQRSSSVFPTSRGALVSPTSVARQNTTHKCPRCRKEYLATINQRRCLAVHLGHKAGGSKGTKGSSMPDRSQLVAFWNSLQTPEKQALLNLKAEVGSESVLRNMEVRLLQRDNLVHTTEQRFMFAAGRTLFEVLIRERGLESLSGEALVTLLSKTSEGTFLYDRFLPARDELVVGFNAEAALSAFISKRLVDALLSHRQQQADQAQRELEELEDAHKADKHKQGDKKRKEKKLKVKAKQKAVGKRKIQASSVSRATSLGSLSNSDLADCTPVEPVIEDSACLQQQMQTVCQGLPLRAEAGTPSKASSNTAAETDEDLTPPPSHARYAPAEHQQPNPALYDNALYSAEIENSCDSWWTASKSIKSSSHAAAPTARLAAAALAAAGSKRYNGNGEMGSSRNGDKPSRALGMQHSENTNCLKSARLQRPEVDSKEAFPALPRKNSTAINRVEIQSEIASKAPVPGISYASAAMSVTVKQAQDQHRLHTQQPSSCIKATEDGASRAMLQQPLMEDPLPASSHAEPLSADLIAFDERGDGTSVEIACVGYTRSTPAADVANSLSGSGDSSMQAPSVTQAMQQLSADFAGLGRPVELRNKEADEVFDPRSLDCAQSAPPSLEEDFPEGQMLEAPFHVLPPMPPYGYHPPPPPPGYYYVPIPPVQFGDVNMVEILHESRHASQPRLHDGCYPSANLLHAPCPAEVPQPPADPLRREPSTAPALQEAAAMMLPAEQCSKKTICSAARSDADGGTKVNDVTSAGHAQGLPERQAQAIGRIACEGVAIDAAAAVVPTLVEAAEKGTAELVPGINAGAPMGLDVCQQEGCVSVRRSVFNAAAALMELSQRWQASLVVVPPTKAPQRQQHSQHAATQKSHSWASAHGRIHATRAEWRPVQRVQPAKQPRQPMWASKEAQGISSNEVGAALPAGAGRQERLSHSFASVVEGKAGKVPGQLPMRGWSSDGNIDSPQWRIQAGK